MTFDQIMIAGIFSSLVFAAGYYLWVKLGGS
jgi:hypothetical protein